MRFINFTNVRLKKVLKFYRIQKGIPAWMAGASLLCLINIVGGCSQTATMSNISNETSSPGKNTQASTASPSAFAQFPEIPIPPNTQINVDKTLVFGSNPWFGQLTLGSFTNANRVYDFFRNNMPNLGWTPGQEVRGTTHILTYENMDRKMTILINSRTLTGSEIIITVSPREQPQSQNTQGSKLSPPVIRQ